MGDPEEARDGDRDVWQYTRIVLAECDPNAPRPVNPAKGVAERYQNAKKINRKRSKVLFQKGIFKPQELGKIALDKALKSTALYSRLSKEENTKLVRLCVRAMLNSTHGVLAIWEIFVFVNVKYPNKYALRHVQKVVPKEFELVDRFSDGEPVQYNDYRRCADKLYMIKHSQMTEEMQKRMFERESESPEPQPLKKKTTPVKRQAKKIKPRVNKAKIQPKIVKSALKKAVTPSETAAPSSGQKRSVRTAKKTCPCCC